MSYVDIIIDAAMRSFDINGIGICNSAVAIETSFSSSRLPILEPR